MWACVCVHACVCVCVQDGCANIAIWPQLTVLYAHTTVLVSTAFNSVTEVCVDSWQLISVTMFARYPFFILVFGQDSCSCCLCRIFPPFVQFQTVVPLAYLGILYQRQTVVPLAYLDILYQCQIFVPLAKSSIP